MFLKDFNGNWLFLLFYIYLTKKAVFVALNVLNLIITYGPVIISFKDIVLIFYFHLLFIVRKVLQS